MKTAGFGTIASPEEAYGVVYGLLRDGKTNEQILAVELPIATSDFRCNQRANGLRLSAVVSSFGPVFVEKVRSDALVLLKAGL